MSVTVEDFQTPFAQAPRDMRFAASVAGFGMLLRHSPYAGSLTFQQVIDMAESATGDDPHGYRREFLQMARTARDLSAQTDSPE